MSKKKRTKKIKRVEKYWICGDCVQTKHPDWGDPGVGTAISGLCGHCDRTDEALLRPTCDYPRKGHVVIWD